MSASAPPDPAFCPACGQGSPGGVPHEACAPRLALDPPRYCTRCARTLDVQVTPTGYSATCRRCDGVHPARRGAGA